VNLRGALGLTLLLAADAAWADQFVAIKSSPEAADPTFVLDRCDDLSTAVTVYATILGSNPVYGKDHTRKTPYLWASEMSAAIYAIRADLPRMHESTVDAYIAAFEPVVVPSLLPNRPLYQADMNTCLELFGPFDE
jgi:hypothetical protein